MSKCLTESSFNSRHTMCLLAFLLALLLSLNPVPVSAEDIFWAWMKGSDTFNQSGIYGTQGTPNVANTPGSRSGSVSWTDSSGALWLFGGNVYGDSFNDLWKFDTAKGNWTWIKGADSRGQSGIYGSRGTPDAANTPGARLDSVSWTDNSGVLWLFGGRGHDGAGNLAWLNDLWKFDTATENWTWIKGHNRIDQWGNYGTQGTPDPANTPGAREKSVSWTDHSGELWLFGGSGYDSAGSIQNLNDLWKFDITTGNWTWIKGADTEDQSGIYGTQGTPNVANTPGARVDSVSWTDNSGELWLFGGSGVYRIDFDEDSSGWSFGRFNDLWRFDTETGNWTWMKGANIGNQSGLYGTQGTPDAVYTPGAREESVSWTDNSGALWLFGGYGYDRTDFRGRLNDLWKFDTATENWAWIKGHNITNESGRYGTQGTPDVSNTPGAREESVSWTDNSGALWLFGGNGYAGTFNDLWRAAVPVYSAAQTWNLYK